MGESICDADRNYSKLKWMTLFLFFFFDLVLIQRLVSRMDLLKFIGFRLLSI